MHHCKICNRECLLEGTIADEIQLVSLTSGNYFICCDCSYQIFQMVGDALAIFDAENQE